MHYPESPKVSKDTISNLLLSVVYFDQKVAAVHCIHHTGIVIHAFCRKHMSKQPLNNCCELSKCKVNISVEGTPQSLQKRLFKSGRPKR